MVERKHRIEEHVARFIFDLARWLERDGFEPGGGIVPEVTNRTTGESRQA